MQPGLVGGAVWIVGSDRLEALELVGLTPSVGISSGAGAINVAHELMHRRDGEAHGLADGGAGA